MSLRWIEGRCVTAHCQLTVYQIHPLITQEHYESPRRIANLAMISVLDGVKTAFSVQAPPVAALRGLGLDLINGAGPLRNGIMRYAMGL